MGFTFVPTLNNNSHQDIYCDWIIDLLKKNYPEYDLDEWQEFRCNAYFYLGDKAASSNVWIDGVQYYKDKTYYDSPFYTIQFNRNFTGPVRVNGFATFGPSQKRLYTR